MTRLAAMAILGLCLGPVGQATAQERVLEVTFVPDGPGPMLWLEVASFPEGGQTARRARFVWLEPAVAVSRGFDDVVSGAPLVGLYPNAPADAPLEVTPEGGLLITLPAPEGWQDRLPAAAAQQQQADAPLVAFARTARLLLSVSTVGVPEEVLRVPASLHGTSARVEGLALLTRAAGRPGVQVVVREGLALRAIHMRSTESVASARAGFVSQRGEVCGRASPSGLLLWAEDAWLRLDSAGASACLGESLAFTPVGGARWGHRGEGPVRGILLQRSPPRGSDRPPLPLGAHRLE